MSKCSICGTEPHFRWTDTHGIGACLQCGAPYRLYHYDENQQRVDKEPELLILPEWLPLTKQYWNETHRNVAPGCFNFPGSSYEVASKEDFEENEKWFEAHKDEFPKEDAR